MIPLFQSTNEAIEFGLAHPWLRDQLSEAASDARHMSRVAATSEDRMAYAFKAQFYREAKEAAEGVYEAHY